jgi:ribosomal protein S25
MANVQSAQAPAKRQNVEKIRELIHEDRRRTVHELADTVGISYGVFHEILTEFENAPHCREVCCPTLEKC